MTTYESEIKTIHQPQEVVFSTLSDLKNLQKVQNMNLEGREAAEEYLKDIEFDSDSLKFSVTGMGKVGLRIIEREPFKTIKLEAENLPISANGWIQLVPVSENETKMRLTIKADLPMMIKMMVDGKLKKGVNAIADAIVQALESSGQ